MSKTANKAGFIGMALTAVLLASGCKGGKGELPQVSTNKDVYVIADSEGHAVSDEVTGVLSEVSKSIQEIYDNNGVIRVIVGHGQDGEINTADDDFILQIYNKDRQCYSEASNQLVSLYYDKGKSIMYSDKVQQVKDLTILDLVQAGVTLCEAGIDGCTVEVNEHDVTAGDLIGDEGAEGSDEVLLKEKVVTLKIKGLDNIKKMYGLYSLENAQSVVDSWERMYTTYDGNEKATASVATNRDLKEARKNDYMQFEVYMTDTGALSIGCKMEVQGTEYTSWFFDGYVGLSNWSIGEGWKEGLSDEEYINLISKVQDNLNTVIMQLDDGGNATNSNATTANNGNNAENSSDTFGETVDTSLVGQGIYETVAE